MPEQEASTVSSSKRASAPAPWWVRLCRWLWKITAFVGVSVLVALGVNVLSTWLTSSKGVIPPDSPLSSLLTYWPITLLVGCCLLLLAALAWAMSRWHVPTETTPLPTAQDRERMLRRLRFRYEQMLAQSLQGVVQMELGLASKPTAVQNAASLSLHLLGQPEQPFSPSTSIVQVYDLAQQELLILGEPGAGKSTLLLELAHHLVEQAAHDATQLLPVLLPLSSWATNRRPLQDWLCVQFALLYDVSRSLGQQWIRADLVLPLLDGLDEMEASARAACIAAINTYHRDHPRPLVVCSRTDEYDTAATREQLALHTAVVVQPFSREQVDAHLVALGKPFAALRAALRKNPVLQTLATTPLILQILMLTYHGTSVRELSQKEAQLRQQVWTDYVQRMVSRKGDAKHYPLHRTVTWLSWLARQMREHNQTIFSLEQIQPDWLPKRRRAFYRWAVGLVCGLVCGLALGLALGLVCGLALGLLFGLRTKIEPAEVLAWSRKGLRRGLLVGLLVGLFGGLAFGLLFGLAFGLFGGLSRRQLTERLMLSPNEGIRRSVKNGLLVGLAFGLLVGLAFGLAFGLLSRLLFGLAFGLLVGLAFWLFVGLLSGLIGAVQHYILRFWLWRAHSFPRKAVPFLDDATSRILLRRVGGGYSFTHRLLLDYFADLDSGGARTSSTMHIPLSSVPPSV